MSVAVHGMQITRLLNFEVMDSRILLLISLCCNNLLLSFVEGKILIKSLIFATWECCGLSKENTDHHSS